MGNLLPASNRPAQKYKKVQNFSTIEDVDTTICDLEASFRDFDTGTRQAQVNLNRSYQLLSEKLKALEESDEHQAANLVDFLVDRLNQARDDLLNDAKKECDRLINLSNTAAMPMEDRIKKVRDSLRVYSFEENKNSEEWVILNDLFRLNKFETFYKIKYMDLLKQEVDLRVIDDNNVESELHVHLLANGKMFQFWKKTLYTGYMQVVNNANQIDIEKRVDIPPANALNHYVSFKTYDNQILCMTHLFSRSIFILMDASLNDVATNSNQYDFKVDLVLMNRHEILCRARNTNKYINLNYKLEETELFRSYNEKLCKALFASNLESIFHMTPFELFVYSADTYSIKIISRENGLTMHMFQVKNSNIKLIKADSDSRIVVKLNNPFNLIQLYSKKGQLLIEHDFKFAKLYDTIEINSRDELIFFSNNRRRLLVF